MAITLAAYVFFRLTRFFFFHFLTLFVEWDWIMNGLGKALFAKTRPTILFSRQNRTGSRAPSVSLLIDLLDSETLLSNLNAVMVFPSFFRCLRFETTSPTRRFTRRKSCMISRANSSQASLGDILKPTNPPHRAQCHSSSRTQSAVWRERDAWVFPGAQRPWKLPCRIQHVNVTLTSINFWRH